MDAFITPIDVDQESLEIIGLTYVSDAEPGIRRHRRGKGFCYRLPDGKLVADEAAKQRIAALGRRPHDVAVTAEALARSGSPAVVAPFLDLLDDLVDELRQVLRGTGGDD